MLRFEPEQGLNLSNRCQLCGARLNALFKLVLFGVCLFGVWKLATNLAKPVSGLSPPSVEFKPLDFPLSRESIPVSTAKEQAETSNRIQFVWQEIESELSKKGPGNLKLLRGPADPEEIKDVENRLGFELPVDLKASLLVHNGSTSHFIVFELLSLREIFQFHCKAVCELIEENGWRYRFTLDHEAGSWDPGALTVGLKNWNLIVDVETGKAKILSSGGASVEHSDSFLSYLDDLVRRLQDGRYTEYGTGDSRYLEMNDFGR